MVDTIIPVILSISSIVAALIGAFISVRSIKERRKIEEQLFDKIIDQQVKKIKNKNKNELENKLVDIESLLKKKMDALNKMQMDLEVAMSENKLDFDKAKYLRNTMYNEYLLEINDALKGFDSKNKRLISDALNQGSEIGKIRYLERITKEALEKTGCGTPS
ncbi:hypothetical protein [Morganella morganii]|uniref:hypothetical protein n=1 Tax=Morganella morganii TaxID=582 RepID=UPI00279548E1|nr:hypothetical protein [Morganella morganii]WLV38621.1 hypothetical protein M2O45_16350 [Morganella morganii]HCR4428812.1 hypothetical protein [Morganella morganii]